MIIYSESSYYGRQVYCFTYKHDNKRYDCCDPPNGDWKFVIYKW